MRSWWRTACAAVRKELVDAPIASALQPSPSRHILLGMAMILGHPIFYIVWKFWVPQPYENIWLRLADGALGLVFFTKPVLRSPEARGTERLITTTYFLGLPFTFWWMFLANSGNATWLASMAAMMGIYYALTDWRIATCGFVLGGVTAGALFRVLYPTAVIKVGTIEVDAAVLSFCLCMGIIMGISTANLKREMLENTMATMGIMAHELRTPFATISLLADGIAMAARRNPAEAKLLMATSERLHTIVHSMNHQIDTQISNARLMRLPQAREPIAAAALVQERIANFPYATERERSAVSLEVLQDFMFEGSDALFGQAVDNLLKNALRAVAAKGEAPQPGDVVILVNGSSANGEGTITVRDRGVGISAELQLRLFEPFFSTSRTTGHGLGLAFCKRVAEAADGRIWVTSSPGMGASFTIAVPAARRTVAPALASEHESALDHQAHLVFMDSTLTAANEASTIAPSQRKAIQMADRATT